MNVWLDLWCWLDDRCASSRRHEANAFVWDSERRENDFVSGRRFMCELVCGWWDMCPLGVLDMQIRVNRFVSVCGVGACVHLRVSCL
jgi:hypothetical protein